MVIEISFPRGGRKPPINKTAKDSKVKFDLFGKKKAKPKKVDLRNEMGPKNFVEENVCPQEIVKTTADLLSYRTIQEGMILMGCIREIQKMSLSVLLPGRISGRVVITQISTPYTKLLQSIASNETPDEYRSTKELFQPGQYVVVKVTRINSDDDKCQVSLSMTPQDVNSDISYKNIAAGMLLSGAISGSEEHGYVVDLGIKNCRAFLPKANVDENTQYAIGELIWCVIQKAEISNVVSTVTINALRQKIESTKIIKETSLDHLLPGMQVDFTISKILSNGLEGKFLNDYTGYVHEGYLNKTLDKVGAYKVGQIVTARIMYITPVMKLTFLSLRSLKNADEINIKDGAIVNCSVLNVTRGGLYVKVAKLYKGYVSFKRLKTPLTLNSDLEFNEIVKKNYPTGSQHSCRILNYDYMEQIFICTMEKDLMKEKLFSYADLKIGADIHVEIREIQKNGLLIQAGRIEGYILNDQLTDAVLSNYTNLKSKFHVGQKLKAKILNVNKDTSTFRLTLKPSLLSTKEHLTSYEAAEYNKQYPGTIVHVTKNGVLVTFFGNVKGWVPTSQLSFEKVTRPELMFKIGQVVNCTVIKSNPHSQKLSLSLQPPKAKSLRKKLRLGQRVDVVVTKVGTTGLEVQVLDTKAGAVVPAQHLTTSPFLAELMLETYHSGDVLRNLVCVNSGRGVPILSLRERTLTEENLPAFETLEPDMLLRCSVNSINEKCMLLQSPINSFDKLIVIASENICELSKHPTNLDIKKNQCLYARVMQVVKKNQNVYATTELSKCWDGDLTTGYKLLSNYLSDLNRIREHWAKKNSVISCFKLGQIITGVVKKKKGGSLVLNVKNSTNEIDAKVDTKHAIPGLKLGQEVKAVILWINYKENCLEVTLNPTLMHKVNQKQNGHINIKIGKVAIADVMMVKQEFILVALRGNGNRQLVFLPSRLHENDLMPNTKNYNVGDEIKTEIIEMESGGIIAVSKELVKNFEKAKKALKRARTTSEPSEDGSKKKKRKRNKKKKDKLVEKMEEDNIEDEKDIEKEPEDEGSDEETDEAMDSEILDTNADDDSAKKHESDEEEMTTDQIMDVIEDDSDESDNEDEIMNEQDNSDEESSEDEKMTIVKQPIIKKPKNKKEMKNKLNDPEEIDRTEAEIRSTDQQAQQNNKKNKKNSTVTTALQNVDSQDESSDEEKDTKYTPSKIVPVLSGVSNFWDIPAPEKPAEESSDDDDKEVEELNKKQKKKKLTPAERAEEARIEEERLRIIETELADLEATPKTADQFDRLVLANPNNSLLWINYIAFHLEGTEIEKARAVARKALSAIEFREEQEKLNVWIAFLNLENRYGTKESFSSILEEAVKMNDALTVHLQALNILAESNKTTEFLELLNTVSRRYKQASKMWTEAAESCYKCDQKDQARNLMQRALKSLDEKQHVNVLVQFAFMESKWGEPERAEALLEKVLASYPRRVDVWCSYVDMLIKGNRIHIAKNVLERAVSQKLPPRKMKTVFTKFIQFETKYGDADSVKKVRQLAEDYVKTALK